MARGRQAGVAASQRPATHLGADLHDLEVIVEVRRGLPVHLAGVKCGPHRRDPWYGSARRMSLDD
jgi:hypothetical protein